MALRRGVGRGDQLLADPQISSHVAQRQGSGRGLGTGDPILKHLPESESSSPAGQGSGQKDGEDPLPGPVPGFVWFRPQYDYDESSVIEEIGNWNEYDDPVIEISCGISDFDIHDPQGTLPIPRPAHDLPETNFVQADEAWLQNQLQSVVANNTGRGQVVSGSTGMTQQMGGDGVTGLSQPTVTRPAIAIGTASPCSHLNLPDSVWDSFDMTRYAESSMNLPIYQEKDKILRGLNANQVTIVEGYTGCGKTTQIPQYIMDEFATKGLRCNIVVTQPRRIAAHSVAQRVCKERNWTIGDLVGYQVALLRRTSNRTRLTYLTTGVLLQILTAKKSLSDYSHIIVDEVHERDLETDLLLLFIKKLMIEREDRETKIIIMSATLNPQLFLQYFPQWSASRSRASAWILKIPQQLLYSVQEFYVDTVHHLLGPDFSSSSYNSNTDTFVEPKLSQFTYETAVQIIDRLDIVEGGREPGGVLVFLPGLMEIETMYKMCKEYAERRELESQTGSDKLMWTIRPLHSKVTSEEQQKVFLPPGQGYRKIILATNIAESSITVTDVNYVIDFCLTKSVGRDLETNYASLRLEWASKGQCVQRRGRVGRVTDGYVFRMVPRDFYVGLAKEAIPEFQKAGLEYVVLCIKNLNLGSPKQILSLALEPPEIPSIKTAVANLKEVGALTINKEECYEDLDGDLTEMGKLMAKLPFDIRISRLIVLGHVFGVLEETVIIAAGLSVKSPFSYPFQGRLLAYLSKLSWSKDNFSDCLAILSLYKTWAHKNAGGDFCGESVRTWARQHFVQVNILREMHICVQETQSRLASCKIDVDSSRLSSVDISSEHGLILKIVMAGAFYPNYFLCARKDPKDYERELSRELAGSDPSVTLIYNGFPRDQPGDLYAQHILERFQSPNGRPELKFDGQKALVQFDSRGDRIGNLSLNLFRGIKMRQTMDRVSFKALSPDVSFLLRDEEICAIGDQIRVKCPVQCPLPGVDVNQTFVSVTHVDSPTEFWVVYEVQAHVLFEIQTLLAETLGGCSVMKPEDLVVGGLCIVLIQKNPYRARIEHVRNGLDVLLYLVDIGRTVRQRAHWCYEFNRVLLSKGIHMIPCLAVKCRIVGLKPIPSYSGTWDAKALEIMQNFVLSAKNVLELHIFSVVDGIVAVDMFPAGNSSIFGSVGLRHNMLSEDLGLEAKESLESWKNLTDRLNVNQMRMSEHQLQALNERQKREAVPPTPLPVPEVCKGVEWELSGPKSPLEMAFRGLTASLQAKAKPVTIAVDSVNSVSLDQSRESSDTAKLLVAAEVGISQKTGNLIARETTVMPPIPGLVGLLTMIFCPRLQLRADNRDEPGRYTGCLSGLGIDPVTKVPVYSDHDMEVVFDTLFDRKDIAQINEIRLSMNIVLHGDPDFSLENLRSSVRNAVHVLLERARPSVEPTSAAYAFRWASALAPLRRRHRDLSDRGFTFRGDDVFPFHSDVPARSWR